MTYRLLDLTHHRSISNNTEVYLTPLLNLIFYLPVGTVGLTRESCHLLSGLTVGLDQYNQKQTITTRAGVDSS